jgi:predicted nucleic acid-binding protein
MRIKTVVVNSSPLIVLFRSGHSYLIPELFKEVILPEQVYAEVLAGEENDAARISLPRTEWVIRKKVEISLSVAAWNLGNGESAVFSYALQTPGARAVVDDLAARRCAKAFGIPTLGTGAILILAKRRGLIDSVREGVQSLRDSGLYLSDSVV